jgi:hypothetical protein
MTDKKLTWEKALLGLTPGGSEFVDDPHYCFDYIKDYQASQHKFICKLVIEKRELRTALQAVLEWLKISDSKKNGTHIRLIESVLKQAAEPSENT